jgi:hypothetical protein
MTAPKNFLGINVSDFTNLLPPQVADAIKGVTGSIVDGSGPEPGSPQPEGEKPIPVDAGSKELKSSVKAINAVLGAIDLIQNFNAVIPDEYEQPIAKLEAALKTVKGWLE